MIFFSHGSKFGNFTSLVKVSSSRSVSAPGAFHHQASVVRLEAGLFSKFSSSEDTSFGQKNLQAAL